MLKPFFSVKEIQRPVTFSELVYFLVVWLIVHFNDPVIVVYQEDRWYWHGN